MTGGCIRGKDETQGDQGRPLPPDYLLPHRGDHRFLQTMMLLVMIQLLGQLQAVAPRSHVHLER